MQELKESEICPFAKWLQENKETAYSFGRRTFISLPTIYKAARGEPLRCSTIKRILYFARQLEEKDFKKVDYSYLTFEDKSAMP